jgi:phage terminase large subunit-like protein
MGGRGAGKTWTGANVTHRRARSGRYPKILLGAATPEDCRDIMIEGESGLLATAFPDFRPVYEPSKKRVTWPNGCRGHIRSGAEPERFRGLNAYFAWMDELASWAYPQQSWDNAMLGLRRGPKPQAVVTTTPKPIGLLAALLQNPMCVVTTDSSYANRANLADSWWQTVVAPLEGTRVGEQEIYAKYLTEVPGALWRRETIEANRVAVTAITPEDCGRVVVAVDPAVTSSANSNETGIIAVAAGTGMWKGHAFVFRDVSGRHAAHYWPKLVVAAYHALRADRVVAEENNGGDLVQQSIRVVDPSVSYRGVKASKGKRTRAEPVAALYEQGRVHHVGTFRELEDQMCSFVQDERRELAALGAASPDRVDALVWGLTELLLAARVVLVT